MSDNTLSSRQLSCVIALFILGSSLVMGVNKSAGQDSWISFILAMAISIPILLMYARISMLFPQNNLFQIITAVFGRIIGFIINLLMTFYALYLGALVIRNFSEFIEVMSMPETPQLPLMILIIITTLYMARSGMKVIGSWSTFFLPLIISTVLFTIVFTSHKIDITNLMPVMGTGLSKVVAGSIDSVSFPFAETVVFLGASGYLKKGESAYKSYFWGAGIGGFLLLLAIIRNITTLGLPMIEISCFPSYIAAKLISVGDFLTRMEGVISVNLILSGLVKIAVCIVAASHGFTEMFRFKDYKSSIIPTGLLMMLLSIIVFRSIMEMFEFVKVYYLFAFPFQIILPAIIWIGCEIKTHGLQKQDSSVLGIN